MSDFVSVEDIRRKIRDGIYTTVTKDSARNELRYDITPIITNAARDDDAHVWRRQIASCDRG